MIDFFDILLHKKLKFNAIIVLGIIIIPSMIKKDAMGAKCGVCIMNETAMLEQLQKLRKKLYALADARGSLTDPDVVALSEEADRIIR